MPQFETLSMEEAKRRTAPARRAKIREEYLRFIEALKPGTAGRLEPGEGETVSAVRRRLGLAAKAGGHFLVVKRNGNQVYFWPQGLERPNYRRRRAMKAK